MIVILIQINSYKLKSLYQILYKEREELEE